MGTSTDEAAVALNEAFARSMPPTHKKRMSESEWETSLHKFYKAAAELRARFRLGVWGRAVVIYKFQKILLAAGFPPDIVRKVVFSLLLNGFAAGR